jgi:hypothetical protein
MQFAGHRPGERRPPYHGRHGGPGGSRRCRAPVEFEPVLHPARRSVRWAALPKRATGPVRLHGSPASDSGRRIAVGQGRFSCCPALWSTASKTAVGDSHRAGRKGGGLSQLPPVPLFSTHKSLQTATLPMVCQQSRPVRRWSARSPQLRGITAILWHASSKSAGAAWAARQHPGDCDHHCAMDGCD